MSELENAIKRLKESADSKELPYILADIIEKNCSKDVINLILQGLEQPDNDNFSEALECLEIMYEGYCMGYGINDERFKTIRQALLKAQENEKKNAEVFGGRMFNKEIIYLKQTIEQCNDKPIYYMSRSFGNKYIVPEDEYVNFNDYAKLQNKCQELEDVLEIIKEKCVNIWFLMSSDTVIDYNTRIRELDDSEKFVLPRIEFNLLKEVLK